MGEIFLLESFEKCYASFLVCLEAEFFFAALEPKFGADMSYLVFNTSLW